MAPRRKTSTKKQLTITQVVSSIRVPRTQRRVLASLGLGKILHRPRVRQDTPSVRGMIAKVQHLITVQENNNADA